MAKKARKTREEIEAQKAKKSAKIISEEFENDWHAIKVKYAKPKMFEVDRKRWEEDGYRITFTETLSSWKSWSVAQVVYWAIAFAVIAVILGIFGIIGFIAAVIVIKALQKGFVVVNYKKETKTRVT